LCILFILLPYFVVTFDLFEYAICYAYILQLLADDQATPIPLAGGYDSPTDHIHTSLVEPPEVSLNRTDLDGNEYRSPASFFVDTPGFDIDNNNEVPGEIERQVIRLLSAISGGRNLESNDIDNDIDNDSDRDSSSDDDNEEEEEEGDASDSNCTSNSEEDDDDEDEEEEDDDDEDEEEHEEEEEEDEEEEDGDEEDDDDEDEEEEEEQQPQVVYVPTLSSFSSSAIGSTPLQCGSCQEPLHERRGGTYSLPPGMVWGCDCPDHTGVNGGFTAAATMYCCLDVASCDWSMCVQCWQRRQGSGTGPTGARAVGGDTQEHRRVQLPDIWNNAAGLALSNVKRSAAAVGGEKNKHAAYPDNSLQPLEAHFLLIRELNQHLLSTLLLTDLSLPSRVPYTTKSYPILAQHEGLTISADANNSIENTSLSSLVQRHRGLIFHCIKWKIFEQALTATKGPSSGSNPDLQLPLSRSRARKFAQLLQRPDREARWTVFAQAFRILHFLPPEALRTAHKLYNTKFMGEHAVDAGGPYR
jgi:hypothetical protein